MVTSLVGERQELQILKCNDEISVGLFEGLAKRLHDQHRRGSLRCSQELPREEAQFVDQLRRTGHFYFVPGTHDRPQLQEIGIRYGNECLVCDAIHVVVSGTLNLYRNPKALARMEEDTRLQVRSIVDLLFPHGVPAAAQ